MVTELPHVSLIMVTEPPMTHPLHPLDSCEVHPLTLTVSYEIEDATRTSRQRSQTPNCSGVHPLRSSVVVYVRVVYVRVCV